MSGTGIHSCSDARRLARRRLPWMVFDYIDGAAGEGHGDTLNRTALRDIRLNPRVLNNVEHRDLRVQVFGHAAKRPFGICPMGMCNLSTPGADLMLARLAARDHVPLGISTLASTSMETMIETAEGHAWFQLYFSGDGSGTKALTDRAAAAGYKTLVLTLDVPEVGRRPRELRRGFKMPFKIGPRQFVDFALHPDWSLRTLFSGPPALANFGGPHGEFDRTETRARADWDYFRKLRDTWKGNLVVKGVLDVRDALRLQDAGADAIQVSNHGGRQLESAPAAISALASIREAVGPTLPLFFDSGIRSGEDVIKAYASGANYVFVGRPLLFAMAAGREAGLHQMWNVLSEETSITLAQMGLTSMDSIRASLPDGVR